MHNLIFIKEIISYESTVDGYNPVSSITNFSFFFLSRFLILLKIRSPSSQHYFQYSNASKTQCGICLTKGWIVMDLCFLLLLPQITGMIFRYRLYALRLVKVDDTAVLYWLSCLQQTLCSGQSDVPFFFFFFIAYFRYENARCTPETPSTVS